MKTNCFKMNENYKLNYKYIFKGIENKVDFFQHYSNNRPNSHIEAQKTKIDNFQKK
jgi:hypothetical protein